MSLKNWTGIAICAGIFLASFLVGDERTHYFNVTALLVVVSGTVGATLASYPLDAVKTALRVVHNAYKIKPPTANEIVNTLLDLSVKSRYDGILSLQKVEKETTVSFLKGALGLMVDGYEAREVREVLATEMQFFRQRRQRHERVFRHMARLAPAFGVTGSVIGLIAMVSGIGDTGIIIRTIPLALTSTLYGIVLSNFLLTPAAERIRFKTQRELLMQKLILDGVATIIEEGNPHKLQKRLEAFLTPSMRPANQKTFDEIRRKYLELRLAGKTARS